MGTHYTYHRHNTDHVEPSSLGGSALAHLQMMQETLPLFQILKQKDDLEVLQPIVEEFQRFKDVIILGTGGSSLGGQALYELCDAPKTRLHFHDNIDPHTFKRLFASINPKTTGVIAISKSGSTSETVMQLLICLEHWTTKKLAISDHFVIVTEPYDNAMRQLANLHGIRCLDHPTEIGGRFSVFTIVGLLPAMIVGLDVGAIRQGAKDTLDAACNTDDPLTCPAIHSAKLQHQLLQEGKNLSVLMPYVDRLQIFALWYRQLWAESLGKEGKGTTPISSIGTIDQHSQLQLYLDGPKDKTFTVVTLDHKSNNLDIEAPTSIPALALYEKKTMGELMVAEQKATIDTLINNDCPVREINLQTLNEKTMGALMMHFVLETLTMAHILHVNPFDQPAVEEGKVLIRRYLKSSERAA